MSTFHIHRLREDRRQQFRATPHTSGVTAIRPKDYEKQAEIVEAISAYSAWATLRNSECPLKVGDVLEDDQGTLSICKYTGFDEAHWAVPEPVTVMATADAGSAAPGANNC